ncbi:hypothetical protein VPH35_110778 [Triticum aestivum]
MPLQRYDFLMDAVTMLCLLPFGITEGIWRKSPPRTIVMSPNGRSMFASKYILFVIGALSYSISDILFSISVDSSIRIRWMWNLECVVPSLCRSSTAITHDTTSGGLISQLSRLQSRRVNRKMGHWRAGCSWRKSMSKCHL